MTGKSINICTDLVDRVRTSISQRRITEAVASGLKSDPQPIESSGSRTDDVNEPHHQRPSNLHMHALIQLNNCLRSREVKPFQSLQKRKQKQRHKLEECSNIFLPFLLQLFSRSPTVLRCPDLPGSLRGHIHRDWTWPSQYTDSYKPMVQETIGVERSLSLGDQRYWSERARATAWLARLEWDPSRAVLYPLITRVDTSKRSLAFMQGAV